MNKQVLLCDDDVHILKAAEFKFKRAGYDVVCAGDGEEAWQVIQRQLPDLVITDCQMPRLDGIGLVERIRDNERTAELPVVMLTAKGFELSSSELHGRLGIIAVLTKPFSPRQLLARADEILNDSPTEPMPAVS